MHLLRLLTLALGCVLAIVDRDPDCPVGELRRQLPRGLGRAVAPDGAGPRRPAGPRPTGELVRLPPPQDTRPGVALGKLVGREVEAGRGRVRPSALEVAATWAGHGQAAEWPAEVRVRRRW